MKIRPSSMALYDCLIDKVVASVFLFALFNVNEGHCFFYPPPAVARPQGHQQPLYEYHEPPNRVGYGYKPSWADIHLQPIAEETPHYQQQQFQQVQYRPEQPVEKSSYQPQQEISQPQYTLPAHTYLQPSEKYQISPPKYQWTVQPSVKYNLPTISNPLTYRDPQQHVNVLVPLRLFGVQMFPPFLERLIQRVQTYYSIYNPPDTLTIPYSINTPPTFPTSSLLPPGDTFISPDDESNVINAEFPGIENNSVENNEGATETAVTPSPDGSISADRTGVSSTESSTAADSTTEDTTKEETVENTTVPASSDNSDDKKAGDDESTASSTSDSDSSDRSDTSESTNSEEGSSSTDKEDAAEVTTTETSSSS